MPRPAHLRTAVSRAYYAAHHAALEFLVAVGLRPFKNAQGNAAAIQALQNSGEAAAIEAGIKLNTLQRERNAADYHFQSTQVEDQVTVKVLVGQARELMTTL